MVVAYISAKQLSTRYFDAMAEKGYRRHSCKYCSLGSPARLPTIQPARHGVAPETTVMVARLTCDCTSMSSPNGPRRSALISSRWKPRLDRQGPGLVRQVARIVGAGLSAGPDRPFGRRERDLIALLERKTGRRFDEEKLHHLMERINEQNPILTRRRG